MHLLLPDYRVLGILKKKEIAPPPSLDDICHYAKQLKMISKV